ncbi:MAG: hypothetical protein ACR2PK_19100 [Acidimicrobiales bacterium]
MAEQRSQTRSGAIGESGGDRAENWAPAVVTSAGISSTAGALAGILWGGIGGRIAMRVLFLTSDDRVRGLTSDDGFEIGRISAGSIFLVVFSAIAGAVIGFCGGLLRMVTAGPTWLVAVGAGITSGIYFGAFIVKPDGIDFRVLEPLWLAVTLFIALPALWGATVVVLTERLLRPGVLGSSLPPRIGDRRFGGVGWIVMAGFTVFGAVGLVSNIQDLI